VSFVVVVLGTSLVWLSIFGLWAWLWQRQQSVNESILRRSHDTQRMLLESVLVRGNVTGETTLAMQMEVGAHEDAETERLPHGVSISPSSGRHVRRAQ
jgi:hypothetical protein